MISMVLNEMAKLLRWIFKHLFSYGHPAIVVDLEDVQSSRAQFKGSLKITNISQFSAYNVQFILRPEWYGEGEIFSCPTIDEIPYGQQERRISLILTSPGPYAGRYTLRVEGTFHKGKIHWFPWYIGKERYERLIEFEHRPATISIVQ